MYLPWWTPFAWFGFVASVPIDRATGGALSSALDKIHSAEIERQFHFNERRGNTYDKYVTPAPPGETPEQEKARKIADFETYLREA